MIMSEVNLECKVQNKSAAAVCCHVIVPTVDVKLDRIVVMNVLSF